MTTKIWNLKAGRIMSVLFERGKNRKILNLRNPVDVDNKKIIDEIDGAMEVLNRYIVSIIDADREIGYDKSVGKKMQNIIDVSTEKDGGRKKSTEDGGNIKLIPKNDVRNTRNRTGSKAYNEYEVAFQHVIPELVDSIKKSDKSVIVKISDVVLELGKGFEKKSVVSVYTGIRHILFKHGVKVEQCTFKEIDPVTKKGIKGLKLSIFQEGDKMPCSVRRSKKRRCMK